MGRNKTQGDELMRARLAPYLMLAALAAFAGTATFAVRSAAQDEPNPADAAPAPFSPNMGDLMNLLIQPRHAKLGLAGKAENWPLANYALAELRQAFAGITKAVPKFR